MAIMNFNYKQAINQASQIETVASDMLGMANKQLQSTMDSIGVCWRGGASQQFLNYCATTQAYIKTQVTNLQNVALQIREVARIIKEAEERAKELQRRSSSTVASAAFSKGASFIAPLPKSTTSESGGSHRSGKY